VFQGCRSQTFFLIAELAAQFWLNFGSVLALGNNAKIFEWLSFRSVNKQTGKQSLLYQRLG
jgi:hypothetical protein